MPEEANPIPKNILIDLRWMFPGVTGGIEILSRSLLQELAEIDTSTHFTVLAPSLIKYDLGINHLENFKVITIDGPAAYWHKFLSRIRGRSTADETARRIASYQADVTLSIPGYIHPDLKTLPSVLIVPDIQHEYFPEFFTPAELIDRRRLYTDSIHQSTLLIAISEFTRQTLIDKLGTPPQKIITIPLAADPIFQADSAGLNQPVDILKKYNLEGKRYFFFPANTWKHKNHATAFKALSMLSEPAYKDVLLICTGTLKSAQLDLLDQIKEPGLQDRVRFLGYCPRADLPALYQNAVALVFPSHFEGFGMPVLEAMLSDCPVICSGTTSLPEIAGDAAIFCDPASPAEFSKAMRLLLEDPALRTGLIKKGRLQAAKYSWKKFTDTALFALEAVMDSKLHPDQPLVPKSPLYKRKGGPHHSSRQDQAQHLVNQSREYQRLKKPLRAAMVFLKSCLLAPEVAFYAGVYSSVIHTRLFGNILKMYTKSRNHPIKK